MSSHLSLTLLFIVYSRPPGRAIAAHQAYGDAWQGTARTHRLAAVYPAVRSACGAVVGLRWGVPRRNGAERQRPPEQESHPGDHTRDMHPWHEGAMPAHQHAQQCHAEHPAHLAAGVEHGRGDARARPRPPAGRPQWWPSWPCPTHALARRRSASSHAPSIPRSWQRRVLHSARHGVGRLPRYRYISPSGTSVAPLRPGPGAPVV
jgi:hypothetical protein